MDSEAVKRQDFFDLIYGVLLDPVPTFRGMTAESPLWQTLCILFLVAASSGITSFFAIQATLLSDGNFVNFASFLFPLFILCIVVVAFFKWFVYGAVLHLLASFWGGKGAAQETLAVCAWAGLPGAVLVPVNLLVRLTNIPKGVGVALSVIVFILAVVWGVLLLVIGLREIHRLSTSTAVLAVFAPVGVFLVLFVILIITLVAGLSFSLGG